MLHSSQQVLRTDLSGMPLEWVDYRSAAGLYSLDQVAYGCGNRLFLLHGGINVATKRRSTLEINSIIATHGMHHALNKLKDGYVLPLTNRTLFQRDDYICLYCGSRFPTRQLSKDHVRPISQGGENQWNNPATPRKPPGWSCWPYLSPPTMPSISFLWAAMCWRIKWRFCAPISPARAPCCVGWSTDHD